MSSKTPLVSLSLAVLLVNFLGHLFGIQPVVRPFNFPAVMTLYTSLALLGLLIFFMRPEINIKMVSLLGALGVQLFSVSLLVLDVSPVWLYLVPSSLPTSLYLIALAFSLLTMEFVWKDKSFRFALCALLISSTVFLFFAFVTQKLEFLGVIKERPGVGLSYQTLMIFLVICTLTCQRYIGFLSMRVLNIRYQPWLCLVWALALMGMNYLFMVSEESWRFSAFMVSNTSMLFIGMFLIFYPFLKGRNRILTVCSWSGQLKLTQGEWVSLSEAAKDLDISISHEIAPEEKNNI